jgi:hypothetical protein
MDIFTYVVIVVDLHVDHYVTGRLKLEPIMSLNKLVVHVVLRLSVYAILKDTSVEVARTERLR